MLSVAGLSRQGLAPASLTVDDGECVSLTGPSGSGKTLLLRAITDLDPNEGVVSLDGEPCEALSGPNGGAALPTFRPSLAGGQTAWLRISRIGPPRGQSLPCWDCRQSAATGLSPGSPPASGSAPVWRGR